MLDKAGLDQALVSLAAILRQAVNTKELAELDTWYGHYENYADRHPFNELMPLIRQSLQTNSVDEEDCNDIFWLCNRFVTNDYDVIVSDIERLGSIFHQAMSNNQMTEEGIKALASWLEDSNHLTKTYPYEEIYGVVRTVLSNRSVYEEEIKIMNALLPEHFDAKTSLNCEEVSRLKQEMDIKRIYGLFPEITIPNRYFCFTGASSRTTRDELAEIAGSLGGFYENSVTTKTDYLVIGNAANPCWAFSCYGRKVQAALNLREKGHWIAIVHESRFWEALEGLFGIHVHKMCGAEPFV